MAKINHSRPALLLRDSIKQSRNSINTEKITSHQVDYRSPPQPYKNSGPSADRLSSLFQNYYKSHKANKAKNAHSKNALDSDPETRRPNLEKLLNLHKDLFKKEFQLIFHDFMFEFYSMNGDQSENSGMCSPALDWIKHWANYHERKFKCQNFNEIFESLLDEMNEDFVEFIISEAKIKKVGIFSND